jgi:RNA polymerase sigma-B factor
MPIATNANNLNRKSHFKIPDHYWTNRRKFRDKIIRSHLNLARRIAHQFARNRPEEYEEYEQIALIGMVKAIDRFDPANGAEFSTYATWVMRSDALHYRRDNGPVPRAWLQKYNSVVEAQSRMKVMGRSLSFEDVAKKLKIDNWHQIEKTIKQPDPVPLENSRDIAFQEDEIDETLLVRKALLRMSKDDRILLDDFAIGITSNICETSLKDALDRFKCVYLEVADG